MVVFHLYYGSILYRNGPLAKKLKKVSYGNGSQYRSNKNLYTIPARQGKRNSDGRSQYTIAGHSDDELNKVM